MFIPLTNLGQHERINTVCPISSFGRQLSPDAVKSVPCMCFLFLDATVSQSVIDRFRFWRFLSHLLSLLRLGCMEIVNYYGECKNS